MNKILEMSNINKSFGPVHVLKDVNLDVNKSEIHGLIGENGAGKSTLMNILSGALDKDSGSIIFDSNKIKNMTPIKSQNLGIGFVHQEFNLAESLTVAENVYINRYPLKNENLGIIDYNKLYEDTQKWLNILDVDIKPKDIVGKLSVGEKQMVEIAKALSLNSKLIIFDEPTTALSNYEIEVLFVVIKALRDKGISCIYISHRLEELFELTDRITVLRDGEYITTDYTSEIDKDYLVSKMVGRPTSSFFVKEDSKVGDTVLQVENLQDYHGKVKDVSFELKKGEVLGFSGLVGSGRTETVRLIFGADPKKSGKIYINDRLSDIKSPSDAVKNKLSLLPEDRKNQGLALSLSINENVNMAKNHNFILDKKKMEAISKKYINEINIKCNSSSQLVSKLSGGNQQKVVVSKWLNTESDIYIFDEPTKGIDIGAKSEIYSIISDLSKQGKSILVVSSEMQELLSITDRLYVFSEGVITKELVTRETNQEEIMNYATITD